MHSYEQFYINGQWVQPQGSGHIGLPAGTGCGLSVVLKPSSETPLNAFMFAELIHEAGLPPGVSAWRSWPRSKQAQAIEVAKAVATPFGGYKQSGNSRELGAKGLHEFVEIKSIQL